MSKSMIATIKVFFVWTEHTIITYAFINMEILP